MHLLQTVGAELLGDLDDREHACSGALGDRDRVADVVTVPVRHQDRVWRQFVGAGGGLRVAGQEGVDQHADPVLR